MPTRLFLRDSVVLSIRLTDIPLQSDVLFDFSNRTLLILQIQQSYEHPLSVTEDAVGLPWSISSKAVVEIRSVIEALSSGDHQILISYSYYSPKRYGPRNGELITNAECLQISQSQPILPIWGYGTERVSSPIIRLHRNMEPLRLISSSPVSNRWRPNSRQSGVTIDFEDLAYSWAFFTPYIVPLG